MNKPIHEEIEEAIKSTRQDIASDMVRIVVLMEEWKDKKYPSHLLADMIEPFEAIADLADDMIRFIEHNL